MESIRAALRDTKWDQHVVGPREYPLALAALAHETEYVQHLRERGTEAEAEGLNGEWFPYVFGRDRSLDTGTPIRRETLELAWLSACVGLTAAELAAGGAPVVYGLCRPPGHHAARGATGGYCYFNNAALAAGWLLERTDRVAILDLDIHHGNGTQDIYYDSDRALYCSIHGDPEWAYPPHTGFVDETGTGSGSGFTYNQPLPQGTRWPAYSDALDRALDRIAAIDPAYVVLSQGFDTFEGDRWGGFLLHAPDFAAIGRAVRSLGRPVVALLEGGYEPANLAAGSLALLDGLT